MNQTIYPSYTTLEQTKLLNEKGIEIATEYSGCSYDIDGNEYKAYHQWELVEWLRVNHGIWINVDVEGRNMDRYRFICFRSHSERVSEYSKHIKDDTYNGRYDKPQDALSAAFDYVLNNLI
jgi:hypothetical protein